VPGHDILGSRASEAGKMPPAGNGIETE